MTMPPGNQAWSATSFVVLSLENSVATSGLANASTSPLAMPMINVAPKSTAKLGAAIVSSVPPMWPTAARRASVRIPSTSHSGPPNRIETPNPQNAAPAIHPTSVAVRLNTVSKSPMMSPRMANDIAVAISATQLDLNRRAASIGGV